MARAFAVPFFIVTACSSAESGFALFLLRLDDIRERFPFALGSSRTTFAAFAA